MTSPLLYRYEPVDIAPPRWSLQDLLEEREISPAQLAERTGLAVEAIERFLSDEADAPLTPEIAEGMTKAFGLSVDFWLGRERDYRESLARRRLSASSPGA